MTPFTRSILAFAVVLGTVMPASAQSANRTSSSVGVPPPPAGTMATESASVGKCRAHCGSLSAMGPHQPHRSVAENQARPRVCARSMVK